MELENDFIIASYTKSKIVFFQFSNIFSFRENNSSKSSKCLEYLFSFEGENFEIHFS